MSSILFTVMMVVIELGLSPLSVESAPTSTPTATSMESLLPTNEPQDLHLITTDSPIAASTSLSSDDTLNNMDSDKDAVDLRDSTGVIEKVRAVADKLETTLPQEKTDGVFQKIDSAMDRLETKLEAMMDKLHLKLENKGSEFFLKMDKAMEKISNKEVGDEAKVVKKRDSDADTDTDYFFSFVEPVEIFASPEVEERTVNPAIYSDDSVEYDFLSSFGQELGGYLKNENIDNVNDDDLLFNSANNNNIVQQVDEIEADPETLNAENAETIKVHANQELLHVIPLLDPQSPPDNYENGQNSRLEIIEIHGKVKNEPN